MKQQILTLLSERNIDTSKYDIDFLYRAGMLNISNNIEFYYDKPYTCESVIKELFIRGVVECIKNKK
jgi:hypothetical protein